MACFHELMMTLRLRRTNVSGVSTRILVHLVRGAGTLILHAALCGGIASADTPARHELPLRAIVRGQNIQPRDDQLRALGYSDVTPQQADQIDRLYQELLNNRDAESRTVGGRPNSRSG